jgi:membrane protease YdiL (CAAX protease family)
MNIAHRKIVAFLALTLAFSSIFYYLIISAGTLGRLTVLGLMWSPGISALITQIIFQRSLRGMGWRLGGFKYLAIAYLLPIGYGFVSYGFIWLAGLGPLDTSGPIARASSRIAPGIGSPAALLMSYMGIVVTLGMVQSTFSALGEEIGWRGLLVPELSKVSSFTVTALTSGMIWAFWHYPLILLADYHNPGAPVWFGMICFTAMVLSLAFVFAWLRLKSASLWPAVLLHASHNLFVQGVFTPLTRQNNLTPYFIDEFGIMLALASSAAAYGVWRWRKEVEDNPASRKTQEPPAVMTGTGA